MKQKLGWTILLLAMTAVLLAGCGGGGRQYDAADFLQVKLEGVDTVATISLGMDGAKGSQAVDLVLAEKDRDEAEKVQIVLNTLEFSTESPTENLSNGDELEIIATYDEELAKAAKVSIGNTRFTYKVEGLEEPIRINVAEDIRIIVEGVNGRGAVTFQVPEGLEDSLSVYLKDENRQGNAPSYQANRYTNGDTLELKLIVKGPNGYKIIVDQEAFTYTVQGLTQGVTSVADSDHSALDRAMRNAVDATLEETYNTVFLGHDRTYQVTSFSHHMAAYQFDPDNPVSNTYGSVWEISVTRYSDGEHHEDLDILMLVTATNVYVEDGSVQTDSELKAEVVGLTGYARTIADFDRERLLTLLNQQGAKISADEIGYEPVEFTAK